MGDGFSGVLGLDRDLRTDQGADPHLASGAMKSRQAGDPVAVRKGEGVMAQCCGGLGEIFGTAAGFEE